MNRTAISTPLTDMPLVAAPISVPSVRTAPDRSTVWSIRVDTPLAGPTLLLFVDPTTVEDVMLASTWGRGRLPNNVMTSDRVLAEEGGLSKCPVVVDLLVHVLGLPIATSIRLTPLPPVVVTTQLLPVPTALNPSDVCGTHVQCHRVQPIRLLDVSQIIVEDVRLATTWERGRLPNNVTTSDRVLAEEEGLSKRSVVSGPLNHVLGLPTVTSIRLTPLPSVVAMTQLLPVPTAPDPTTAKRTRVQSPRVQPIRLLDVTQTIVEDVRLATMFSTITTTITATGKSPADATVAANLGSFDHFSHRIIPLLPDQNSEYINR